MTCTFSFLPWARWWRDHMEGEDLGGFCLKRELHAHSLPSPQPKRSTYLGSTIIFQNGQQLSLYRSPASRNGSEARAVDKPVVTGLQSLSRSGAPYCRARSAL